MNRRLTLLLAAVICHIIVGSPLQAFQVRSSFSQRTADSLVTVGMRLYTEGKYEHAISALSSADTDSVSAQTLFYLGMSYAAVNDYQSAHIILRRAVHADSLNPSYRFQFAKFLTQFGSTEEAQQQYERIIRTDTTFIPAYFQLGVLINAQRNDPRREEVIFRHIVRYQPRDFLSYHFLGDALIRLGSSDEGRAMIATSISLNPNHVTAITQLAGIYYLKNNLDEALRLYTKASSLRPSDPTILFNVGECLRKLRMDSAAVSFYRRAFFLDTSNARYAAQLGYAYFLRKEYDSSAVMYRRAIRLDDENPQFWLNLALVYQRMDSAQQTIDAFHGAVQASKPEKIGDIYAQLGTFYYRNDKFKEALNSYNKALTFDPTHTLAHFYLGAIYDRQSNTQNALRHFENYLNFTQGDTTLSQSREVVRKRVDQLRKKH
jgi:tetratricopeptide (TPR) repeat protein